MTAMTEVSWAKDLLHRMGFPVTRNNMTSILAWEYAEGGHFHNSAHYNPLNTTMAHDKYGVMAGGSSAGVATYPDYQTGMRETIATLNLHYYTNIRHDLARSAPPAATVAAIGASPWGTSGSLLHAVLPRARAEVARHPGLFHSTGHGKQPPKHGTQPAKGGKAVVLDLHELDRLTGVYRNATDEILRQRRLVGDIVDALAPACAALPDRGLADAITSTFAWLTEPGGGFDQDARGHDDLVAYTGNIAKLAREADANSNGTWTRAEKLKVIREHGEDPRPSVRAVLEAFLGGTIVRRSASASHGGGGHAKNGGGNGHGKHETTREQKIDKMLAFAAKQHAVEHDGDNRTKYGAWFGNNGQPWCADFVSYVFAHSGNPLPPIQTSKGFAYVPYAISYAREHGELHTRPHRGDIFLYKDGEHTGIVSKVYKDGSFDTVEGNWSNQVAHVHRRTSDGIYYFWTAIK